jgi:hypothetical protein
MDRDELHDLITILKEEFEAGRIKVNSIETLEAVKRVRFAADGKIDPSTVSGSVRALALATAGARHERAIRKIPLREVQEQYFESLGGFFGPVFDQMKSHGASPQEIASAIAKSDKAVAAFTSELDGFAAGLREFWDYYGPVVEAHLSNMRSLKVIFGGDFFPSYTANIACSVGLYTDTIVLPDPLHRITLFHGTMPPRQLFQLSVKHALNALTYKEIALADVETPIVVIAPDYLADDHYRASLTVAGQEDTLEHCSKLFGRQFSSMQDLDTFLRRFSDVKSMVSSMVDPGRMLFDTDWSGPLEEQFERHEKENASQLGPQPPSVSFVLQQLILGRMMTINDAVFRSARFGGSPLVDAPTSWQYLLWKYEYNGNVSPPEADGRDLLIAKAMSLSGSEHGMLSDIPPDALIELRREGALEEVRKAIQKGMKEIDTASDATLREVAENVVNNIDMALSQHDRQLKELSSARTKFFGQDVSRWVVVGGLSVAASLIHSVPLGFLASASTFAGQPSPLELWKQYKELNAKSDQLRRSPAGMMFRHLKGKFGF